MPDPAVRAFLAVPRDADWAAAASGALGELRAELPSASWTRPESWHLTLRFLGQVGAERLRRFAEAIGEAAAAVGPLRLDTAGAAVFPARGRPRVLGIALAEPMGGLAALAASAETAARAIGLPPEDRLFRPHVTLARLKGPWPRGAVERFRAEVARWSLPPWPASAVVLFASALEPEGAVHTPLARFGLAADAVLR